VLHDSLKAGEQLLQDPHLAKYYDYLLTDPLPEPHAVFKFHYRSWHSLISLNLVPEHHDRELLPMTPSLWDLFGRARAMEKELAQPRFHKLEEEERQMLAAAKVPLTLESLSTVPVSMSPREKLRSRSWGELRSVDSDEGDSFLTAESEKRGEIIEEHTENDDSTVQEDTAEIKPLSLEEISAEEDSTDRDLESDTITGEEGDEKYNSDTTSKAKKLAPRPPTPYAQTYDSDEPEKLAVEPLPQNGIVARARGFFGNNKTAKGKKLAGSTQNPAEDISKSGRAPPVLSLVDPFDETPSKRSPTRMLSPIRRITTNDVPGLDQPKDIKDLHPNVIGWLNDSHIPGVPESGFPEDLTHEPRSLPTIPDNSLQRPLPVIPPSGESSFNRLRRQSAGLFRSASARDPATHIKLPNDCSSSWQAQRLTSRNLNLQGRRRAESVDDTTTQSTTQPTAQPTTTTLLHKPSTAFSELSGLTIDQSSTASIPIMIHPDDIPIQSIEQAEPAFDFQFNIPTSKFSTLSTLPVEKELPAVPTSVATESVTTSASNFSPDTKKQKKKLRSSLNVFAKIVKGAQKEMGGEETRMSRSPLRM
jgi:hypothetical protein